MHENSNEKLRTVKEISLPILGVTDARTYDLIRRRIIPAGVVVRITKKQIRINMRKLLEWIEKGGNQLMK